MILSSHEEVLSTPLDSRPTRSGLTLVEMLVATTLTLILFLAVTELFSQLGAVMQDGRAIIELSGELRSVSHTLQQDLDFRTAEVLPWVQPGSNQGYFEIIEGPDHDKDFASSSVSFGGDADDILAFTAYSKNEPFVGLIRGRIEPLDPPIGKYKYYVANYNGTEFTPITSHYAEIIYWTRCTENDDLNLLNTTDDNKRNADETVTLHRRVRLIRPDILVGNVSGTTISYYTILYRDFNNYFDLSARIRSNSDISRWETNSLEDLQDRGNRYAHKYIEQPPPMGSGPSPTPVLHPTTITEQTIFPLIVEGIKSFEDYNNEYTLDPNVTNIRDRSGEDVVLSKVLAFDMKVFDPEARIIEDPSSSISLRPGDVGYANLTPSAYDPMTPAPAIGQGAFVDLNWQSNSTSAFTSTFSGSPNSQSKLQNELFSHFVGTPSMAIAGTTRYSTYDTWPFYYEMDGLDQDNDTETDQGTNGFDDNGNNIIDDTNELETMPPYPVPLRGISVQVRAYEPGTRQIRQDTIMADFLPE